MQVNTSYKPIDTVVTDALIIIIPSDKKSLKNRKEFLSSKFGASLSDSFIKDIKGETGEIHLFYPPKDFKAKRVLLAGVGESDKVTPEVLRRTGAAAAKATDSRKFLSLTFMLDNKLNIPHPTVTIARSLTEGAMLGVYKYSSYITDAKKKSTLKSITIIPPSKKDVEEIKRETSRTEILCNAVIFTRNLANAPGSEIYPESLAAAVQKECGGAGCKVTILGEKKIASLKMGGMLGVSKGSARQPRFIVVEWNGGGRRDKPVVLIGKGITFDTGGISLKPSAQMGDMKMDMSGAAAVAGTMHAAASLKIKKNVIGLIPACENMPSGTAMRPGDILRMMNGLTVEVDNTDAEGRLVLADALVFAKRYKPEAVVDVATLTGACVVALGHHATGIMGNDKNLIAQLKDAGDRTYERVWELPLFDEYEKQIQSNVADIKNIGGRWGGTITAAWFLKKFVDDFPWAHLDIAGTAILDTDSYYTQKGASGVGVRLLTEWLENKVDR